MVIHNARSEGKWGSFRHVISIYYKNGMWRVLIRAALTESILVSTHNIIYFHDKIRKFP